MHAILLFLMYFLSEHVFFCPVNRHYVLLDVAQDRYLCMERKALDSLLPWLHGGMAEPDHRVEPDCAVPHEVAMIATELLAQGILTQNTHGAKLACATRLPTPATQLEGSLSRLFALLRVHSFYRACRAADHALRTQSLRVTVEAIRSRKAAESSCGFAFDWQRAASRASAFHSLRLSFRRPYLCLFDSLALLEWMACDRLFPAWVFGVATDPFEAHCWLQHENVVLNDSVERVAHFTPIMVV
jgi:hypothetical protein